MNANAKDLALVKKRLLAELKRDKKKTIVLTVLLVVAAGLGVRFLGKAGRPPRATAAPAAGQTAGSQTDPTDAQMLENTGEQAQRDRYIRQLDAKITRDIFVPSDKYFDVSERDGGRSRIVSLSSGQGRDNRREALEQEAERLVLQSTVVSQEPTAIINGQVVHVGDEICGFKVIKIRPRQCLVERSGFTVVLELDKSLGKPGL